MANSLPDAITDGSTVVQACGQTLCRSGRGARREDDPGHLDGAFGLRGALDAIQELAGQQELTMTQRNMDLNPAALKSAIRLLDGVRTVKLAGRQESHYRLFAGLLLFAARR